jgi:hypothetical protein
MASAWAGLFIRHRRGQDSKHGNELPSFVNVEEFLYWLNCYQLIHGVSYLGIKMIDEFLKLEKT